MRTMCASPSLLKAKVATPPDIYKSSLFYPILNQILRLGSIPLLSDLSAPPSIDLHDYPQEIITALSLPQTAIYQPRTLPIRNPTIPPTQRSSQVHPNPCSKPLLSTSPDES